MDVRIAPTNAGGLAWSRQFPGSDGQPDWEWQHFDLVHAQAHHAIKDHVVLPDFAKQILGSLDENPRILTDGETVAGVLPAYARSGDADEFELTCWHFAMLPHCLVTGRRRPTRTLVNMWESVEAGFVPSGPAHLVDRCIGEFAREVRARLATLAASLDPVEDRLIEPSRGGRLDDLGKQLGEARREATRLKRALVPIARTIDEDEDDLPSWTGFTQHDAGHRQLHAALDDIDALYDHARSLQDELTTRLAEEANRRLYLVSIVTTVLLPATFVTGFFGMNTGGMLWSGDEVPHGTIFAALLCLGAVMATLLALRWKRLF